MNLRYLGFILLLLIGVAGAQTRSALPKRCSQSDVAKYGEPVMFSRVKGVAFGVSTQRRNFQKGEPINVAVWLSNESRRDVPTGGCSLLEDYLDVLSDHVDVFDSTERRLLSKAEQEEIKLRKEGRESVHVCSASTPVMDRRPGFCGVVEGGDLNSQYNLAPGTYKLREKKAVSSGLEDNAHILIITIE